MLIGAVWCTLTPSRVADAGHCSGRQRPASPWVSCRHDHIPTPSSDTALVGIHELLTHLTGDTDWPRQVLDMIAEQLISAGDAAKHLADRIDEAAARLIAHNELADIDIEAWVDTDRYRAVWPNQS